MKPNRTVVVSGEKIEAVGTPEQPAAVPRGAIVLDGKGKFLVPGLIDAHVHVVPSGSTTPTSPATRSCRCSWPPA